jgi:hypothetical protein
MKLNWVSPLPPAQTDIANFTVRVLAELTHRAEVSLWTQQDLWSPFPSVAEPVHQLNESAEAFGKLQCTDLSFYNIGNNHEFHSHIWKTSRAVPGVVVLHDTQLQGFFAEYYLEVIREPLNWVREMRRHHGRAGGWAAEGCLNGQCGLASIAARFPLTGLAVQDALGVMVHTPEAERDLRSLPCPVAYAPLPYGVTEGPERERWSSIRNRTAAPPWKLAIFGFLGKNRRIRSVLEALAGLAEKNQFRLEICGASAGMEDITQLIRSYGLADVATWRGFVTDFDGFLADADLAINLRYPTMGGASGSQLCIWDHALPSLVTRSGWYANLPADCVRHVEPDHEIEHLRAILREFLDDPVPFRQAGRRGRAFLERHHQPAQYVSTLLALAQEAREYEPRAAAIRLADRAGAAVRPWSSCLQDGDLDRISRTIYSLAGGSARSPVQSGGLSW